MICFECSGAAVAARMEHIPYRLVSLSVPFVAGSELGAGVRKGDYLACPPSGALGVRVFVQH